MTDEARGLLDILGEAPEGGPAFVEGLRRAGLEALRAKGLPGRKDEAWRFTSVRDLEKAAYEIAAEAAPSAIADASSRFAEDGTSRVVVVDGRPTAGGVLAEGVAVESLAEVLAHRPGSIEAFLGKSAGSEFFAGLNAAMFRDGVVVRISRGVRAEAPIHLVHAAERAANDTVANPRILVIVEEGAAATIIETHLAPAGQRPGRRLTNLVSEVSLGAGATLEHVLVHDGLDQHVARVAVHQAARSEYRSRVLTFGGALVRLDLSVLLAGEGANAELDGLYLVADRDHVDHQLRVIHRAPRCTSRQTYRGVLDASGSAVFDGTTEVEKGAQRTEAHQENRNLLLSDSAVVNTKPHLRIDADDVVCSHGATVGSLDREQLFYLRSRGIPEPLARAMLTFAFLRSLVDRVSHEPTRESLVSSLLSRLPEGESVQGTSVQGAS